MPKRNCMSAPPMPAKLKHYTRDAAEDTQQAIDSLLSHARKTAKCTLKRFRGDTSLIIGPYGKRREAAVRNTLSTIIDRYDMTEKTSRLVPTAELWTNLNLFCVNTLEDIDRDASILSGAALWLLDRVEDRFELQKLLDETDKVEPGDDEAENLAGESMGVKSIAAEGGENPPIFFDLNHSGEVVQAVVNIFRRRYGGRRSLLDVDTDPGAACDAFLRLMDLIDPDDLRDAVSAVRSLFWRSLDGLFQAEYALAGKFMEKVTEYNAVADRYNAQVDSMCDAIHAFIRREKEISAALKPPAGNPLLAENTAAKALNALKSMAATPLSAKLGGLPRLPPDDLEGNIRRHARILESLSDQAGKLEEKAYEAHIAMIRLLFDYSNYGFTFADAYRAHYPGVDLPVPSLRIDDPYELCMGVVLLCSPAALENLYAGAEKASVKRNLDLPWLTGAMCGMARDAASRLPWGIRKYGEDELEFRDPPKPLDHPDWYEPAYRQGDGDRRSLAQILYETTGAVLPRHMDAFDDAFWLLRRYGVRGKQAARMTELMTLMHAVQYRTARPAAPSLPETTGDPDALRPGAGDGLREQVNALRERLKKTMDEAHAQERRARKAEQALAQERMQAKEDRRELAALREMLFLRENADASGDAVSVSFPYEVKRRLVIYGGHETWRKAMKGYLTGDIRYMDKEQAIIDRSVIRNADGVWIQSNALSHRQYYAVIDEVRKTGVPVKYFLYASARKCAEQVAEEEG